MERGRSSGTNWGEGGKGVVETNISGGDSAPHRESRDKTYHWLVLPQISLLSPQMLGRGRGSAQSWTTLMLSWEEMSTICSLLVENARSTACSVLLPQQRNLIPAICFCQSILSSSKEWCWLLVFGWSRWVVLRSFLVVIISFSCSFG